MSTKILRNKQIDKENSRKMMVRMLHETLPTCEKMNRLVQTEKTNNIKTTKKSDYYTLKYEKYTNDGMCPCCGQKQETVRHLFYECKNQQIEEIRDQLKT